MVLCTGENCDLHSNGEVNPCLLRENVLTNNFRYRFSFSGECLVNDNCSSQCIQAHQNLIKVADFIQHTLQHSWEHEKFLSNINYGSKHRGGACWDENYDQAFFGQHLNNEGLCSCATALDIVTHEFFHGVSIQTTKLAYERESGALDESYCDIFGILLLNFNQPDISQWQWEFGRGFGEDGMAIRDLSQPAIYGHPEKFKDFIHLEDSEDPDYEKNDHGYVHYNSGIHNKAAYELLISRDDRDENYLFSAASGAQLFYSALIRLGETQSFEGSHKAIRLVAKSLFRQDSDKQDKLKAIDRAFASVGII